MVAIAGDKARVKASGGVRTQEDGEIYIKAGASRIGTSNGVLLMNNEEITEGY
jgi:deoxyribose-phosphate aldolase